MTILTRLKQELIYDHGHLAETSNCRMRYEQTNTAETFKGRIIDMIIMRKLKSLRIGAKVIITQLKRIRVRAEI